MKHRKNETSSVKQIRARLIRSLLRAFIAVVSLLIISILGVTTYTIVQQNQQNPFFRAPNASLLEAFYIGKGDWTGINSLLNQSSVPGGPFAGIDWKRSVLVNANGQVIIDHGNPNSTLIGQVYQVEPNQNVVQLMVNGRIVGYLIQDRQDPFHPIVQLLAVVNPIIVVSISLGILTLVFAALLMRKVVDPLADVIDAAEKVGKGDLTARIPPNKRADDLAMLGEHFNAMTEALERNDTERKNMTADIAHELRTPLTVLRGRLEGIVDGIYPANEASIAPALEETYLLERLVEDLRLLSLAESHQLHYETQSVDLKELTQKVINVFEAQAESQNVKIEFTAAGDVPSVAVDPQRTEQVIGNIIANSLRYMPGEGLIKVELTTSDDNVELAISDNGPGVPEDQLECVFTRFWRSEKSRARTTGGAGLGLTIAKRLIEAQGGTIIASHCPEGGLKITIQLPKEIKST